MRIYSRDEGVVAGGGEERRRRRSGVERVQEETKEWVPH